MKIRIDKQGKKRNLFRDLCGSIMPMTAIMLPVILGTAGMGVDASMWMMNKRDLQSAADAASIAAAWEYANNRDGDIEEAALREAQNNGYDPDSNGELEIEQGVDDEGRAMFTANISQEDQAYFSSIVYTDAIYTSAAAASVVLIPTDDFCMLALDPEADGAVTAVGSVEIDASGCGIAVNSNSDSALDLTGSVVVNIGDLNIVGDMEVDGSVDLSYNNLETNSSRVPDPYEDLEVPDFTACSRAQVRSGPTRITRDTTLNPGVYCGGITITGNENVTFNPGVYIIDGGDFSVTGGGQLLGEGVSFVLTNSGEGSYGRLDITGGKEVLFSAPEEGEDMEGVVFYQDREAPESSQCNSLTGTSAIEMLGAAYFPSNCFTIGGNNDASSSLESPCSRIIAKTIKLHGNPSIGNNCDGSAAKDIGMYSVKLVM